MKRNNIIRDSLNENLSGLSVSRQQHDALMQEITGGKKVKRKLRASLVLAMTMVLLAAMALAWGLRYSPDVTAARTARNAVMEQYGLSRDAMDMFFAEVEESGQKTIIRFAAPDADTQSYARMGVYTAQLAKDGTVSVQWTHDDVDPAIWTGDSLDAVAWGDEQILAYRAKRDAENRANSERVYVSGDSGENDIMVTSAPPRQGKLTEAQALDIAAAAMKKIFGFTEETLTLFEGFAGLGENERKALVDTGMTREEQFSLFDEAKAFFAAYKGPEGQQGDVWVVVYHPGFNPRVILPMHEWEGEGDTMGDYVLTISDETGAVLHAAWSLADEQNEKTYTESTWGQARVYSADMLPWVLDLINVCQPLREKGEVLGASLGVEDSAAYDQAFRDAGFDAEKYNHVLPEEGDIPYAQAVEMVAQVLQEECGVSREVFDESAFAYADLTQEKNGREWYFWVQNTQEQCGWTVVFDAKTGEIRLVVTDPFAHSNG